MNAIQLALATLNRARHCISGILKNTPFRDADETLCEITSTCKALEAAQTAEPVAMYEVICGDCAKTEASYQLNGKANVAVATDYFWEEDMTTCPRAVKVQLLGAGGVATYSSYFGDPFWIGWAPLPRRK
jgi:hypothetical protein